MSLDKSKPFGEVHGLCAYKYMQNDKFYSGQGEEVNEDGTALKAEKPTPLVDVREEATKDVEAMTVDAIKENLTNREIEFDSKALKADLVSMLVDAIADEGQD